MPGIFDFPVCSGYPQGVNSDFDDAAAARLCYQCGYDLRGLPSETVRCPECGTPNPAFNRYTVRRRIFTWGYHFDILDAARACRYLVRSAQVSLLRHEIRILDVDRTVLARVREQPLAVSLTFHLLRDDQPTVAVRKRMLSVRPEYSVFDIEAPEQRLTTVATQQGHRIMDGETPVAVLIRRRWAMWDMFDLAIAAGADELLCLAAALVMERQR